MFKEINVDKTDEMKEMKYGLDFQKIFLGSLKKFF